MTSAMATDGPCSVRGGAWASRSSPGSSVPWPLLSNLSRGPTAPNPDPRMGQCAKNNPPTHIYINIYIIYVYKTKLNPDDASAKESGVGSGTRILSDFVFAASSPRWGRRSHHVALPSLLTFWLHGSLKTQCTSRSQQPLDPRHTRGQGGGLGRDSASGLEWHRGGDGSATPAPTTSQRSSTLIHGPTPNLGAGGGTTPPALPIPVPFLAPQPHARSGGENKVRRKCPRCHQTFGQSSGGWKGGENNLLRREIHVKGRTLQRMLRKPSLTVQLPYTELDERLPFPWPHLHSLGRREPWSDAVMCVCVCKLFWVVSFFPFHLLKWKHCIMPAVSLSTGVVSGPSTEALRPGRIMRGRPTWVPVLQLLIPGVCACGGCFLSVGFIVCVAFFYYF